MALGDIQYQIGPAGSDGATYDLPDNFFSLSPADQIAWINQSAYDAAAASALEQDLGLDVVSIDQSTTPSATGTAGTPSEGANASTTQALNAAIAAAPNGVLLVPKNSPAYIVATENYWSYSVAQSPAQPTMYTIKQSSILTYGLIALVAVLALSGGFAAGRR